MKSEVPSPCIKVCRLENNHCVDCGMSKHDIAHWDEYSNEKKFKIVRQLKKSKK